MSKYTTELRYICEMMSGFSGSELETKTPDQVILAARSKIFNFAYPIYDASHKPELETKILRHYYTREINSETFGLWHLQLEATLCEIMPKYNRLYAAEARILEKELKNIDVSTSSVRTDDLLREDNFTRTDDLHDADRRDTTEERQNVSEYSDQDQHSGTNSSTRTDNLSEQDSTTRTDNLTQLETRNLTTRNKFSDTPQGTIANVDNDSYLTDYRNIGETGTVNTTNTGTQGTTGTRTNTGTQTTAGTDGATDTRTGESTDTGSTTGTSTGTADHTGTQKNDGTVKNTGTQTSETLESGYRGEKYYAALLADYAEKILNIDLMIIKELNNLFFLLW